MTLKRVEAWKGRSGYPVEKCNTISIISFGYRSTGSNKCTFFQKCLKKQKKPNLVVIFINNSLVAKSAYVGKIIYGVWPFSQTSGLSQVWLVWEE